MLGFSEKFAQESLVPGNSLPIFILEVLSVPHSNYEQNKINSKRVN